jgi:hypothetical protein
MGEVYQDEDQAFFIDIEDIFPTEQAGTTFFDLRFGRSSWPQVIEKIKQRFPHKQRLGWYRTHLFGIKQPQSLTLQKLEESIYDPRLSLNKMDISWHRLFPESWHVVMIVDVRDEAMLFYQRKQGEIVPCQGYYIYDKGIAP